MVHILQGGTKCPGGRSADLRLWIWMRMRTAATFCQPSPAAMMQRPSCSSSSSTICSHADQAAGMRL